MTDTAVPKGFSSVHIERLREKLSEWGNPTDSSEGNFIDLWFVDADVLSIYINSLPNDYASAWPSLFALADKKDVPHSETQIDEHAKTLTDSVAIAISYFLFGRFRETLAVQSRRFLLTPEHDRELDAMTVAVAYAAQENVPNMMSQLAAHYKALSQAEKTSEITTHIDNIFLLLREGSPSSKVYRTLDLRQRLLNTMQDTAFFPSGEPGAAFAFQATSRSFTSAVKTLASKAFEVFLASLVKLHPGVEKHIPIKEAVFAFHRPDRRLMEYVEEIRRQAQEQRVQTAAPPHHRLDGFDEQTLSNQAKIAAREVSDVYAFARLVALAKYLNENHRQDTREWRINLLTGSNKQRALSAEWKKSNSEVGLVRLVHPLSMMGTEGFAQPDAWPTDSEISDQLETTGGYALRALKHADIGAIDVEKFITDFKGLLSTVAVSCAPNRERWMRNLRLKLQGLDQHSRSTYMKSIRDVISRDYVSTFAQLNLISPNTKGQLPVVSLPALALPLEGIDPSPAQKYVMRLHGIAENTNFIKRLFSPNQPKPRLAPPLSELLKVDTTGYSALLCAGLGYLAQGRSWLSIAEAVANTAVAFVSTQTDEDGEQNSYPDGNEAFFLAAFVSRMKVDGAAVSRNIAYHWMQQHRSLMARAYAIHKSWEKTEIGRRPISKKMPDCENDITLSDLVGIRYASEELAANVFGHLIDRLEVAELKLMDSPPMKCLKAAKNITEKWRALESLDLLPQYQADFMFIGSQLTASIIQAWLCVLGDDEMTFRQYKLDANNEWIAEWVNSPTVTGISAPGSTLVRVLVEIFNARTGNPNKPSQALEHLDQMQFAVLDEQRVPFLKRLLTQPEVSISTIFHT